MIAAVSDWKTRTSRPGVTSSRPAPGRLEGNNFMRRPGCEVLMLLVPKVAVDVAALDQLGMAADVVDLAALQHEDRVRVDQRRQPMRDDDHCPSFGDTRQIGIDDGLALG